MNSQFDPFLVRILHVDGEIEAAGFLVSEIPQNPTPLVLTCAHVVASALGLHKGEVPKIGDMVKLDFPFLGKAIVEARVENILPIQDNGGGDIAALHMTASAPSGTEAMPLLPDLPGHNRNCEVYGFPIGSDTGVYACGAIVGGRADGSVQIVDNSSAGYYIKPGFSGAPVWDTEAKGVVGMVVSAEQNPDIKVGFMLPSRELKKVCPAMEMLLESMERVQQRKQSVVQAFMDLRTQMTSPPVCSAVAQVKTYFVEAREKIILVSDFKDMHDALHKLENNCFNNMVRAEHYFPSEDSLFTLYAVETDMRDILGSCSSIAQRSSFQNVNTTWISNRLQSAYDNLQEAIQKNWSYVESMVLPHFGCTERA